jgi:hypothetical protein
MHWNDRIVVITIPVVGPTCKVNFYQPELTDGFQQQLLVGFIFLLMAKHFPFPILDVIFISLTNSIIFQRGRLNHPGGALAAHPQCPAATVVVQVGMLRAGGGFGD